MNHDETPARNEWQPHDRLSAHAAALGDSHGAMGKPIGKAWENRKTVVLWDFMGFYGILRHFYGIFMGFYRILWEFYGILWDLPSGNGLA